MSLLARNTISKVYREEKKSVNFSRKINDSTRADRRPCPVVFTATDGGNKIRSIALFKGWNHLSVRVYCRWKCNLCAMYDSVVKKSFINFSRKNRWLRESGNVTSPRVCLSRRECCLRHVHGNTIPWQVNEKWLAAARITNEFSKFPSAFPLSFSPHPIPHLLSFFFFFFFFVFYSSLACNQSHSRIDFNCQPEDFSTVALYFQVTHLSQDSFAAARVPHFRPCERNYATRMCNRKRWWARRPRHGIPVGGYCLLAPGIFIFRPTRHSFDVRCSFTNWKRDHLPGQLVINTKRLRPGFFVATEQ